MTILLCITLVLTILAMAMALKACYTLGTNEKRYLHMMDLLNESIKNIEDQLEPTMKRAIDNRQRLDDLEKVFGDTNDISNTIQLAANEAVSDAMDQIDKSLDDNVRAINTIWQSVGTLKKRLDKIDPVKREPIDPVENLKRQSDLMDTMLKESTDKYADRINKQIANSTYGIPTEQNIKPDLSLLSKKYLDKLNAWKEQEQSQPDIYAKRFDGLKSWSEDMEKMHVEFPDIPMPEATDTPGGPAPEFSDEPDFDGIDGIEIATDELDFDFTDFFQRREERPTEVLEVHDICEDPRR